MWLVSDDYFGKWVSPLLSPRASRHLLLDYIHARALTWMFHELMSRDHEDGLTTG
jgi:hypothetical protein